MSGWLMLSWLVRFVHIASAIAALGAPFYVRLALMPAAGETLDDPLHQKLRERLAARWRHVVYVLITLFLLTGAYNFFVETRLPSGTLITARWKGFTSDDDKRLYQMLFGIKVLCAFGIFFLASALAGRTALFAPIRKHARVSVMLLLVLGAVVILCSTLLRFLPLH